MNMAQKVVVAAGAALAALRMVFPVKYTSILGMRFKASGDTDLFQDVDWSQTGMHVGGIVVIAIALFFVLKKR